VKLILVCILLHFATFIDAQTIGFSFNDGNSSAYSLEDVRKKTFDTDLMNLHFWDGTIYSIELSTIGHIDYNSATLQLIEELNAFNLEIFPNPMLNVLNLQYSLTQSTDITVELYDTFGKVVFSQALGIKHAGINKEVVNIDELNSGVYNFRFISDKNTIVKKVIKE